MGYMRLLQRGITMRRLVTVTALAVMLMLSAGAHAAPFDCPWTAEADPVPSQGGNYGGNPP